MSKSKKKEARAAVHEIHLRAKAIDRLSDAKTPVADVFRLTDPIFRVADALLDLYAHGASVTTGDPRESGEIGGAMWSKAVRRESVARRDDAEIARASVAVDASEHPHDGGGWRIIVSIDAADGRRMWVDSCSHDGTPGFLVRVEGTVPEGIADAFAKEFHLRASRA